MSEGKTSMSNAFNHAAKAVKWAGALFIGALMTEPLIFSLVHANMGGIALMKALDPTFQSLFNSAGITKGLYSLAQFFGYNAGNLAAAHGASIVPTALGSSVFVPGGA